MQILTATFIRLVWSVCLSLSIEFRLATPPFGQATLSPPIAILYFVRNSDTISYSQDNENRNSSGAIRAQHAIHDDY